MYLIPTALQREVSPCPLSEARAYSWLSGTSIPFSLWIILAGRGGAKPLGSSFKQPEPGLEKQSLFYTFIYFVCVYLCGGCLLLTFFKALECCVWFLFISQPPPWALQRREGISWKRREKSPRTWEGSGCQLLWTFPRNKHPLNFQTVLSSVG